MMENKNMISRTFSTCHAAKRGLVHCHTVDLSQPDAASAVLDTQEDHGQEKLIEIISQTAEKSKFSACSLVQGEVEDATGGIKEFTCP